MQRILWTGCLGGGLAVLACGDIYSLGSPEPNAAGGSTGSAGAVFGGSGQAGSSGGSGAPDRAGSAGTSESLGSPATLPGLWLRADTAVSASSGRVARWADLSGNGVDATMTLAERQPALIEGAVNGLPVVRFDGAQSLYLERVVEPTAFAIFVVGRNRQRDETFSIVLGPGGNSPNNQLRWENGTEVLFVGTGNQIPSLTAVIGDSRVYHLLSLRYDGSSVRLYRDGTLRLDRPLSGAGTFGLAQIGAWYSSYYMVGDLAEVIVYPRALSDIDFDSTGAYLQKKYRLPGAAPSP